MRRYCLSRPISRSTVVQVATGDSVDLAYVDQVYIGERAAKAAADHSIALEAVKLTMAKRGFVLLPPR